MTATLRLLVSADHCLCHRLPSHCLPLSPLAVRPLPISLEQARGPENAFAPASAPALWLPRLSLTASAPLVNVRAELASADSMPIGASIAI